MATIRAEFAEKFERLYGRDSVPDSELKELVDNNISYPSMPHFQYHQILMARRRKKIMNRVLGRNVEDDEAVDEYQRNARKTEYIDYFLEYIVPVFCNIDEERRFDSFPAEDKEWVDGVFDEVIKLVNISLSTLIGIIRKNDNQIARIIEQKGLVARAV